MVDASPVKSVPVTTTVQASNDASKTASAPVTVGIESVQTKSQVVPSQTASSDVFKKTTTSFYSSFAILAGPSLHVIWEDDVVWT